MMTKFQKAHSGLTLADARQSQKLLSHLPPQLDGERKYNKGFMGWHKGRDHSQNRLALEVLIEFIVNKSRAG